MTSSAKSRIRERVPAAARWLIDFARDDADSGLESLLRLRLHLLGIRLDCQVTIPTVGRVDFVLEGSVILKTDGKENHDETLRFDYAQVVHNSPMVEAAILAALTRAYQRH